MSTGDDELMRNELDRRAVESFRNFLSWGQEPVISHGPDARVHPKLSRAVPPAWWAYALGATTYCPPMGVW